MNKFLAIIAVILSLILLSVNGAYAQPDKVLPPILDYYPNCDYQILKQHSVSDESENPDSKTFKAKLLKKLGKKARNLGADALILLDKTVKQTTRQRQFTSGRVYKGYKVEYTAEFIKQCEATTSENRKLTPLNRHGEKTLATNTISQITRTINIRFPSKAKLTRPSISDSEISLANGLYGVQIGTDFQNVIDTFGAPSVTLKLQQEEFIISYGRSHWLYFQYDRLVKIQSEPPFLSQDTLNMVPLLDFFDNNWHINNLVKRKANLDDVRTALKINTALNDKNQLIIEDSNNLLALNFAFSKNHHTNNVTTFLQGFSMQAKDYRAAASHQISVNSEQYHEIEQQILKLDHTNEILWQELSRQLGEPLGHITLTADSQLNIYNAHLIVYLKNSELKTIYLNEQVFSEAVVFSDESFVWKLGRFKSGSSLAELSSYFPENAFITDGEVGIETENYSLSLFFDDEDGKFALYQAEIKLF
ncbi:hypothetical protein [Thalassotalea sp. ND16A]|uniref:hypothetical protein n=1 Tax=Thalassotalea sp. ND16A TaxID=1535422 RepID=UPI00051A29EB|nr:hypothetical protein [Thalassotalea sp. ND16A]KGJ99072.1 hypothetical protein ND16A_0403 [Thalassotalea sp. ND16A]